MKFILIILSLSTFSAFAQMEGCSWVEMPKVLSIRGANDNCGPVKLCIGKYRCDGGVTADCAHLSRTGECGTPAEECGNPSNFITWQAPNDLAPATGQESSNGSAVQR